jgi:hypothetical protein
LALRASTVIWGDDQRALITESWWKTRRTRTWLIAPDVSAGAPTLLFERSMEDRYAHPGQPVTRRNAAGRAVLLMGADRSKIYLAGQGASPEGDRPFLDEFNLETKQAHRLWRSTAPHFESFVAFADESLTRAMTLRESVSEPPNYFLRTLGVADDGTALRAITHLPDPLPEFAGVEGAAHLPAARRRRPLRHPLPAAALPFDRRTAAHAPLGLSP